MQKPTRRTGVAATVLATAGFTTILASTASGFTERDEILIDRTGYDVAGDGFTDGVPDAPAIVEWTHSSTSGRSRSSSARSTSTAWRTAPGSC